MTKSSMTSAVTDTVTDWYGELLEWFSPFLDALGRSEQRHWAPIYVEGLLGPGDRKSVEPMAERVCPGDVQQLHNFVSTSPWATEPLESVLATTANALVGGKDAVLIIDDTALVKQGRHSVGVARQYCGVLGKRANCQALVSLTLAQSEVPVPVALRLYLPETWASDAERRREAKVPPEVRFRTKGEIALAELDRVMASGVEFGTVLADAGYGKSAEFRGELSARGLTWAAGIGSTQKVYPADVTLSLPEEVNEAAGEVAEGAKSGRSGRRTKRPTGRPRKHAVPSAESISAEGMFESLPASSFRRTTWRMGTKGPMSVSFAALRVRVADGPAIANKQHLPGAEELWLLCERRSKKGSSGGDSSRGDSSRGERKYYVTNHPPTASRVELLRAIKARWSCEQAHQQMKEELGLDHFEGRSWLGLHHHALLTMIAFAFLQHLRLETARKDYKDQRKARGRKRHRDGGKIRTPRTSTAHATRPAEWHAWSSTTAVVTGSAPRDTWRTARHNRATMSSLPRPTPRTAA